jgi:hypothetical protein
MRPMNIVLWALQAVLALHTLVGAGWKFSHTAEQTMLSLKAIPNGGWKVMAVIEILCAFGLIIPALSNSAGVLAPCAAAIIAGEMLLLTGVHLSSGAKSRGPVGYWLGVAAISAFVSYARFMLTPF